MFKKQITTAKFIELKNIQLGNMTTVVNTFGKSNAWMYSYYKAKFELEDETVLLLDVGKMKAKKLQTGRTGTLTYRNNRLISFKSA